MTVRIAAFCPVCHDLAPHELPPPRGPGDRAVISRCTQCGFEYEIEAGDFDAVDKTGLTLPDLLASTGPDLLRRLRRVIAVTRGTLENRYGPSKRTQAITLAFDTVATAVPPLDLDRRRLATVLGAIAALILAPYLALGVIKLLALFSPAIHRWSWMRPSAVDGVRVLCLVFAPVLVFAVSILRTKFTQFRRPRQLLGHALGALRATDAEIAPILDTLRARHHPLGRLSLAAVRRTIEARPTDHPALHNVEHHWPGRFTADPAPLGGIKQDPSHKLLFDPAAKLSLLLIGLEPHLPVVDLIAIKSLVLRGDHLGAGDRLRRAILERAAPST